MTLDGNLDLTANGSHVTISNGLSLNGTATLNSGGSTDAALLFSGTQTLGGTGTVLFNNSTATGGSGYPLTGMFLTANTTTLTIGPNITIHGGGAEIGQNDGGGWSSASNVSLVVQGTIDADSSGKYIYVDGSNWSDSGTAETTGGYLELVGSWTTSGALATNGGALYVEGSWSTTGTVTVNAGSLSLYGQGTWDTTAPLVAASGTTVSFDSSLALTNPITLSAPDSFSSTEGISAPAPSASPTAPPPWSAPQAVARSMM